MSGRGSGLCKEAGAGGRGEGRETTAHLGGSRGLGRGWWGGGRVSREEELRGGEAGSGGPRARWEPAWRVLLGMGVGEQGAQSPGQEVWSCLGPSAGRGRGRRLPAPGLQRAQHRVQRLERGLLLQPESLPGHQPELQPLQQLGHDHLHLHLCTQGAGRVSQRHG